MKIPDVNERDMLAVLTLLGSLAWLLLRLGRILGREVGTCRSVVVR